MLVMIACQLGIQSFVSKCIWIKNPKLVIYVGKFITIYKNEIGFLDNHLCDYQYNITYTTL
jgi:hypothetical protein